MATATAAPALDAKLKEMMALTKMDRATLVNVNAYCHSKTGVALIGAYVNSPEHTVEQRIQLMEDVIEHLKKGTLPTDIARGERVVEPPKEEAEELPPVNRVGAQPKPVMVPEQPNQAESSEDPAALIKRAMLLMRGQPVDAKVSPDDVKKIVVQWAEDNLHDAIKKANGNGAFPDERVKKVIGEALANHVQRIEIVTPKGEVRPVEGRQHYKFGLLVKCLAARLNVLLVGPAGSSKTTAAHEASKALELPFEAISVGPMTSKADIFGFIDAGGKYHDTATVRRGTDGGVMLWDELDAGNASVMTYGNMLLSNGHFATPTGMRNKHADFLLIGGANTYCMGADRVYVGRNQMDGATNDRFVMIDWDYDTGLEAHMVGVKAKSPKLDIAEGGVMEPKEWLERVTKIRKAVADLKIRHIISPRATLHGVKLFAQGVGRKHVEDMVIWKGLDEATKNKISSQA